MSNHQFPALATSQSSEMGCHWLNFYLKRIKSLEICVASLKPLAVRALPSLVRTILSRTPTETIYYYYDGLGRRIAKRRIPLNATKNNSSNEEKITWFAWDGDLLALEENQTHQTNYVYEPGSFIPLAQIHLVKDYVDPFQEKTETGLLGKLFGGSSKTSKDAANDAAQTQQVANGVHESAPQAFYTSNHERIAPKHYPNGKTFILHYQVDQLGTPQLLHDDAGNMHWLAYYQQAWGEIKPALSGLSKYAKIKNPLRFQGQYFDEETGLHYNRHRYYDPHSGRFISQDPIGLAGGLNLYAYAPNPTGWVDPLGLKKILKVHSNGTNVSTLTRCSLQDFGHSWIEIIDKDTGKRETWGTFGHNYGGPKGLRKNAEIDDKSQASRGMELNSKQEVALNATILKYKKMGDKAWKYHAPCSTFARDAWQNATGEKLKIHGPYSNPDTLKKSIINANEGVDHKIALPSAR